MLRDIQETAIPAILDSERDVLIASATASGKTEAALLPISSLVARHPTSGVAVLYVSPLIALINDQQPRFSELMTDVDSRATAWHGHSSPAAKKALLADPAGALLITPESLESLLMRESDRLPALFGHTLAVVIDEVHAFVGTERGAQLQSLLHRIDVATGRRIRRIGLSATAGDLPTVARFVASGRQEALILESQTRKESTIAVHVVEDEDGKGADVVATWIYETLRGGTNLVFPNSRAEVERYSDLLRTRAEADGAPDAFEAHHGSLSKQQREEVETVLKYGSSTTVIATSTLELGIDVGSIDRIVQIGAPPSVASLQQRLGRSGRRDDASTLDLFVIEPPPDKERSLDDHLHSELIQSLACLALLDRQWFEPPVESSLHLSTLVQQVLSFVVQRFGATVEEIFEVLCSPEGAFAAIGSLRFSALIEALTDADYLYRMSESEVLHLGSAGEKLTKTAYFLAAFATPIEYSVISDGVLGKLPLTYGVDYGSPITFAGRRWRVRQIDDDKRKIYVVPAPDAVPPRFLGGIAPVHERVRREMYHLLCSDAVPMGITENAKKSLEGARALFTSWGLERQHIFTTGDDLTVVPWTGDRAMLTMGLQLSARGLKARSTGLTFRIRKCSLSQLSRLLPELIDERRLPEDLARNRHTPHVHKHHRKLSPQLVAADFASEFVDLEGASRAWTRVAAHLD